jgi:hypothetical protein
MAEAFVAKFFSELHREHLKNLGYTKTRYTFSRELPEYVERVQFQGSSWNGAGEPWRFYVNVGIQFRDLPRRTPDRDFPNTHAHGRIEEIVRADVGVLELAENELHPMIKKIASLLVEASDALRPLALAQYPKCKAGLGIWFPPRA